MTDPKAPLPDEVERCLSEMPNVGGFGEEWSDTIRAHTAALEAENKRLIDVLKDLVEIYRRDSTSDPDLIATDRHREETWGKAKSAIAQTGEK